MWTILKQIGVFLLQYWRYLVAFLLGFLLKSILPSQSSVSSSPSQVVTLPKQSSSQNTATQLITNIEKQTKMTKKSQQTPKKILKIHKPDGTVIEKITEPAIITTETSNIKNTDTTFHTITQSQIDTTYTLPKPDYLLGINYNFLPVNNIYERITITGGIRLADTNVFLTTNIGLKQLSIGVIYEIP